MRRWCSQADRPVRIRARDVMSTIPAPKSIEKIVMNLASAATWLMHHSEKFRELLLPYEVGFMYAHNGMAKACMFISKTPNKAKPRRMSMLSMRSPAATGMADNCPSAGTGVERDAAKLAVSQEPLAGSRKRLVLGKGLLINRFASVGRPLTNESLC